MPPIGPIELVDHVHTLTQAADFPMFEKMLAQTTSNMRWAVGILSSIIILLVGAMWRSLHVRIGAQRSDDKARCDRCKSDHDEHKKEFRESLTRELDAIWQNLKVCCAASGVAPITMKDVGIKREDT